MINNNRLHNILPFFCQNIILIRYILGTVRSKTIINNQQQYRL